VCSRTRRGLQRATPRIPGSAADKPGFLKEFDAADSAAHRVPARDWQHLAVLMVGSAVCAPKNSQHDKHIDFRQIWST